MQSRCCCPPERAVPDLLQDVLHFVPERGPAQGLFHPVGQFPPPQAEVHLEAVGDVIKDAHGKRGRLLEDHAHAAAQFDQVIARIKDVLAVQQHLAFGPLVAVQFIDAVVDADVGGFAAARRPDDGGDPVRAMSRLLSNRA